MKERLLVWNVTNARMVNAGRTERVQNGVLSAGYIVEADAAATDPSAPMQRGTFRITLTAFSPAMDMPGQKAGAWYVQGDWSITDEKATEKEKAARHSPTVIKGSLTAELAFNPASDRGTVNALIRLPLSPADRRAAGKGTFSGNEKFEGMITLNAKIWPEVMKIKGVAK
jgi:hypothetical protein